MTYATAVPMSKVTDTNATRIRFFHARLMPILPVDIILWPDGAGLGSIVKSADADTLRCIIILKV